MGFLEGTWALVAGIQVLITGRPLLLAGHAGPWAAWGAAAALLGALWMIAGNLYLFQNRAGAWRAMAVLIVVSSFGAGWAGVVLAVQLALLLLPATRRGLAAG